MAVPHLWRPHLNGLRTFDRVLSALPAQAEPPRERVPSPAKASGFEA